MYFHMVVLKYSRCFKHEKQQEYEQRTREMGWVLLLHLYFNINLGGMDLAAAVLLAVLVSSEGIL